MTSCPTTQPGSPPQYSAPTVLPKPMRPTENPRYNRNIEAAPATIKKIQKHTVVRTYSEGHPAGNLPDGWREYIHYEGVPYYYSREKRIVTSVDPRYTEKRDCLIYALSIILGLLQTHPDMEIFLDLEPFNSNGATGYDALYYLVDHRFRQIFWAEDISVDPLGFPQFITQGGIKSVLTPEYWVHVDYYPMHLEFDRPMIDAETELFGILSQGVIDDKTSPGSTCPYGAAESMQYLAIIRGFQEMDIKSPYRIACMARLWSAIGRARHINSFGTPHARLDRLQGMIDFAPVKPSFTMTVCEAMTFFIPDGILRRITTLFNARVVYHRHWDIFFADLKSTWLKCSCMSAVILLCDVTLISYHLTNIATLASASLSSASIFIGLFLHHKHPQWKLATGPDISSYVMSVEDYYQGLRPLSIILALPQAAGIYAALAFHLSIILVLLDHVTQVEQALWTLTAMSVGLLPIFASVAFFAPAHPGNKDSLGSTFKNFMKKWKDPTGKRGGGKPTRS